MKTGILAFLAFLAALALGAPAMAQTVGPGAGPGLGAVGVDSLTYQGQTMKAVNTNLSSVSINILGTNATSSRFDVYSFDRVNGRLGSTALYSTTFMPPSSGVYSFSNINVRTTNGASLAFVLSIQSKEEYIDLSQTPATFPPPGYTDGSRIFGTGDPTINKPNIGSDDLAFSATFTAAAAAPEPATWGLMILGFGLVGAALRRRAGPRAIRQPA